MFEEVRKFWNRLDYLTFYEGLAIPVAGAFVWIFIDAAVENGAPNRLYGAVFGITIVLAHFMSLRAEERALAEEDASQGDESPHVPQSSMPEPTDEDFDRLVRNVNPQKLNDFFERRAARSQPSSVPNHVDVEDELRRIANEMRNDSLRLADAEAKGAHASAASFRARLLVLESQSRQLASARATYDEGQIADLRHEFSSLSQNLGHAQVHGSEADVGYLKARILEVEAKLRLLGA